LHSFSRFFRRSVSSKSCRPCSTAARSAPERRTAHIAELRKRASEADAKLKRLYDAIENGIADLADPMLKDRVAELKAIRDQARADAERTEGSTPAEPAYGSCLEEDRRAWAGLPSTHKSRTIYLPQKHCVP
jgi:hypothetical protein